MIKTPLSTVIGGAFWTPGATVIGGNAPTLDQQIQKLFANGEQGFAYDPNDMTGIFQDAAGTTAVNATGQPVGLMLDKSGRENHAYQTVSASRPILQQTPILGNDLAVNGDFNSGLSAWTGTTGGWTADGGVATSSGTISGLNFLYNTNSLAVGDTAKIIIKLADKGTKGSLGVSFADGGNDTKKWPVAEIGSLTELSWVAKNTIISRIYITARDGWDGSIDKVEIRKVTGYRTDQNYIEYDGVDDKLTTNLPEQLSGCTVIRSVPNAGTQILTGQTIPTTYADNTTHCGLIVINRALTPSETSTITAEFNKRAGV